MKYLKKFNEELKPRTYRSAARKLSKLGHIDRSKDLVEWSNKIELDQQIEKWKQNIKEFSKFGKFKLNIVNPETKERLTGDFYLDIVIDRDSFGDSLDSIVEDAYGSFLFFIGIIPSDKELLDKCLDMIPDNDLGNGFFWGMIVTLDFKLESDMIKMTGYTIENYDENVCGDVSFADRPSANKFKTNLKKMFTDPSFNYPSGYTDITDFYDMFYRIFGAEYGLNSDYGLTPELIGSFINTLSPNEMYKSI
jgi:hypothetical protein